MPDPGGISLPDPRGIRLPDPARISYADPRQQRDRLNQIERLLVNIQDPLIGAHAALVGYDAVS